MARETINYSLKVPEREDLVEVDHLGWNFVEIDRIMAGMGKKLDEDFVDFKVEVSNKLAEMDGKINRLEDGVFSNITGNPFLVSFGSIEGVIITRGIWNEANQRIEC